MVSEVVRFELLADVGDRTAGALARQHRRAHSGVDAADYLIAATAIVLEAELLTMNVRHFPMLTGLRPAY